MPRTTPRPSRAQLVHVPVKDLLEHAVDISSAPAAHYANHAQLSINLNEIYLDFYRLEPARADPSQNVDPIFIQRIILPINLGKGLTNALANLIDNFQRASGQEIPNQRAPLPGEAIDVWK